jgi:hypothetical protein
MMVWSCTERCSGKVVREAIMRFEPGDLVRRLRDGLQMTVLGYELSTGQGEEPRVECGWRAGRQMGIGVFLQNDLVKVSSGLILSLLGNSSRSPLL